MTHFQEFPKWKYHAVKQAVIVSDASEETSLGEGWVDHPDLVSKVEPKASEPVEAASAPRRAPGRKPKSQAVSE